MKFSYNWLQSFFDKKLPNPEQLSSALILHFAEVEEVKKEGNDWVLDIDVRPNRAGDCFSHMGVAREISAVLGLKMKIEKAVLNEDPKLKTKDFVDVEILGRGACLRYTARVIFDVKVASSPDWMQQRLITCGLRPINSIVDIANYVMLEIGQPLHAFDEGKLEDKKIIVRYAREGEKIVTLDEGKYDLDKDILVISDSKKPIAIAGIKGGKPPEIDKKTKIVVLESANFDSHVIRRGSRKLSLRTDASLRFEHGVDPNLAETAINRAAYLIQEIAGGRVLKDLVDVYPKKVLPKNIKLDLDYVKNLLGIEIPKIRIESILKTLGFSVKYPSKNSRTMAVSVPTLRRDVLIAEDLVEEIGRVYGYEKIPAEFPLSPLTPPRKNQNILWESAARDLMRAAGFTEVFNYSFVSAEDKEVFRDENSLELENPLSADYRYLRQSLLPNLLKNLQKNKNYETNLRLFEIGKIFKTTEGRPSEKRQLAAIVTGSEFFHLKGAADAVLKRLGISDIVFNSCNPSPEDSKKGVWHFARSAEIWAFSKKLGFLGEISPKISSNYKIPQATAFELDFEMVNALCSEDREYTPISRFPSATRDVAVLVPSKTEAKEVFEKIHEAGGNLIKDIELFDVYEGKNLPCGTKNLAYHIIYQSAERTLNSKEIDDLQNNIIKNLEKTPGWQVRK